MRNSTFQEIYDQILQENDLAEENTIVDRVEIIDYMNRALERIDSEIQRINFGKSYFKAEKIYDYKVDDHYYDLPEDIYGNNIIAVILLIGERGSSYRRTIRFNFDVSGKSDLNFQESVLRNRNYSRSDAFDGYGYTDYKYDLLHSRAGERQVRCYPLVDDAVDSRLLISYQRECNKILFTNGDWDLSQICDLPRFDNIIRTYAGFSIMNKREQVQMSTEQLGIIGSMIRTKMEDVSTFTNDATEDIVDGDLSFYENSI